MNDTDIILTQEELEDMEANYISVCNTLNGYKTLVEELLYRYDFILPEENKKFLSDVIENLRKL